MMNERDTYITQMFIKNNSRREKSITTPKSFSSKVEENPTSFLENFMVDVKANDQNKKYFLKVIGEFLKDDAYE